MFFYAFKLIFLSSLVGVSIADDAFQDEIPDRELFSDIDKSLQRFSDSLYATIRNETTCSQQSIVVSPMSVHMALGLPGLGAAGKTSDEIWRSLHLEFADRHNITEEYSQFYSYIKRNPLINIANEIFIRDGLQFDTDFINLALSSFGSKGQSINFADTQKASSIINDWVAMRTKNQIHNMLDADTLNSDTQMVIINAIQFKGDWEMPFNPSDNTNLLFHMADGDTAKEIEVMRMDEFVSYTEFPELDAKIMELPYRESNCSMVFILPNTVNGLTSLGTKFNIFDFIAIRNALTMSAKRPKVLVSLPKFKIEFKVDLENVLTKMGMASMFSAFADFTHLLAKEHNNSLIVSKVIHKAVIEVNEQGTEAAASTGISVVDISLYLGPSAEFVADHPFRYLLMNGDVVLFTGDFVGA